MVELNQMKLEKNNKPTLTSLKRKKMRDGWLRDDEFYDISYFYHLFIYSWEEMVEMRRMTLERIKEEVLIKRRNKSHFISLINQSPFYHQFDRI